VPELSISTRVARSHIFRPGCIVDAAASGYERGVGHARMVYWPTAISFARRFPNSLQRRLPVRERSGR